jgi:hypothetical protein
MLLLSNVNIQFSFVQDINNPLPFILQVEKVPKIDEKVKGLTSTFFHDF